MKIKVNTIEGKTSKKGAKQNKVYTVISRGSERQFVNEKVGYIDESNWYDVTDEKGNRFTIWDVNRNWSKIGISRYGAARTTFTTDFEVIEN